MANYVFDHIHLFSPDPEATAAWYERIFGAEIIRTPQPGGKTRLDLKLGGGNIFILDVKGDAKTSGPVKSPHQGLDHFGLHVNNIDAVCADLKSKGVKFTREPETIRPGVRIAFLVGPEDVSIELLERTPA